jgi:DNA-binding protein HU
LIFRGNSVKFSHVSATLCGREENENILKEDATLNKQELVANVAEQASLTKKDAEKAVNAVFETIKGALSEGDKIQLIGFGTFEVKDRAARKGRNPQTGKEIEIAASRNPVFKAGKALKDAVN